MLQKVYIINKNIEFWPGKQSLSNNDNSKIVQLTGPASRCLELLVLKMDLVTQKELYEHAWHDSGFIPSPNTLYQSISVLRRAFKEVDNSDVNFILTETRKGFRLNPLVSVITESLNDSIHEARVSNPEIKELNLPSPTETGSGLRAKLYILSIFSISICVLIVVLNKFNQDKNTADLSSYNKIKNINNCVFIMPSNIPKGIIEKVNTSLLNCQKKPFNYVTAFKYSSHVSIMSCDKKIEKKSANCSILYLRNKNEIEE